MARGGKREGSGRPTVDKDARSRILLDDLLIPAFNAIQITGEIEVGVKELQAAYGRQGLADWRVWFEEVELGHGYRGCGAIGTIWRLKLKLAVAAKKLLEGAGDAEMLWPSELLKAVRNKRAYESFWNEHEKHSKEFAAEYGTSIHPREAFNPLKTYSKIKPHQVRDNQPHAQLSNGTKGWSELVLAVNYGLSDESTVSIFIPEEELV